MTADPARIEFIVHDDHRLIAAVGTIVAHVAHRAGLSSEAEAGFAAATMDACRETFPLVHTNGSRDGTLRLVAVDHPDRVEVTIEHMGEALPTAGLDTFVAGALSESGLGLSSALQGTKVDRVQYETRDGVSRVTLIKYCSDGACGHESKTGA